MPAKTNCKFCHAYLCLDCLDDHHMMCTSAMPPVALGDYESNSDDDYESHGSGKRREIQNLKKAMEEQEPLKNSTAKNLKKVPVKQVVVSKSKKSKYYRD